MPSVLGYLRFGEIVSSSLSFFSLRCLSFARFGEPALAPFPGFLLAVSDYFVFLGYLGRGFGPAGQRAWKNQIQLYGPLRNCGARIVPDLL